MNENDSIIPRIPIGEWGDTALDWIDDNFRWLLDFLSTVLDWLVTTVTDALILVPALVLVVVFALIGLLVRSWALAVGTVVTFLLIVAMDQWVTAMQTLALVLIATLVAILIAVPIGILAASSDRVSAVVRPVLDFMQTMPAFVYLIPAVVFFGIGVVPGIFATVIFALPPGVGSPSSASAGWTPRPSRPGTPSAPPPVRSCGGSSCRSRRRRSWRASTR